MDVCWDYATPVWWEIIFLILGCSAHEGVLAPSQQTNWTENYVSNVTRIFVETNASFLEPKLKQEDFDEASTEYDPILPFRREFSNGSRVSYVYNRKNDLNYFRKKANSNPEGDLNETNINLFDNESRVFYDDYVFKEGNFSENYKNNETNKRHIQDNQLIHTISKTKDIKQKLKTNSTQKKKRKPRPRNEQKLRKKERNSKSGKSTRVSKKPTKSKSSKKRKSLSKIRLPSSIVPIHYVLRLHPRFEDFQVNGSVEIEVEVRQSTPRIKLHSSGISTDKNSVKISLLKNHKEVPIRNIKFNPRRQFMTMKLARKLKPGRVYVINIAFSYFLNEEAKGFYRASYINSKQEKVWLAATQFWPSDARRAFPCFDEPGMKATFDVHLARSESMTSLSNMPLVRNYRKKNEPNWVWDQFATSSNMSTYLLAFTITDFTSTTNDKRNETNVRVWTRSSLKNKTSLALDVGSSSLKFYHKYFDLGFPLPKLDMIALPKMSFSAIENWGLITYRESAFLHDATTSTPLQTMSVSWLVAHEVAHQWFGNLVTFEWWNDLWLNEGFATYMSFVAVDDVQPTWKVLDQFVVIRLQEVMALDALPSSHPVSAPIKDPSRINEIFDSIPYDKGASIIRMMQNFLSEATFRAGLKEYLQHFQYKNTKQDDLWHFLTKAAQKDKSLPVGVTVKGIMDTWTLQAGYPLLQVERYDNGTAFLTQKRFLLGKLSSKKRKEEAYKWWIPITFTTQKRPSFKHTRAQTWLREEDDSLRVTGLPPPDQWVIFNLQQTGYYRVNYDLVTWHLLINQLHVDHKVIHVTNRAQLIDDSLNLARAGILPYDLALQLVSYLKHETNYIPWKAGLRNLNYIREMLQKTKDYGLFKNFLLNLLDSLVNHLSLSTENETALQPKDTMQKKLMKADLISWLCRLDHKFCREKANRLMLDVENDINIFDEALYDPSYSEEILCSAIQNGHEELWEKVLAFFTRSSSVDHKSKYLKVLGCTKQIWLLNRYLHMIENQDSGVLRQDGIQVYTSVTESPVGSYVAWDTFRISWNKMKQFSDFTYFVAPGIIKVITDNFNTHHHLRELNVFRESVRSENVTSVAEGTSAKNSHPILPALNNAVAKAEVNLRWMKRNYASIIGWLIKHQDDGRSTS